MLFAICAMPINIPWGLQKIFTIFHPGIISYKTNVFETEDDKISHFDIFGRTTHVLHLKTVPGVKAK